MDKKKLFLILGMSLLLSSCAEQVQQGPNPISVLQQDYQTQQQEIMEINRRLDSLDQSLADLRVKLGLSAYDNITHHPQESIPPTGSPNPISSLPTINPSQGVKHLSNTVTIINQPPNQGPEPNLQALVNGTNTPQTPMSVPQTQETPRSLYQNAYSAYQSRQYEQAKNLFKQYILRYPNNTLTSNAYYWLGMSYKSLHHNNRALAVLLSLIDKCKKGELSSCSKAPSAYFSAANIYKEMGQKAQADKYYKDLIRLYPNSIEAALAKSEIEIQ